jgi:homoserine dehydrogenase
MHLKLAFIGFGNVAREFARILDHDRISLEADRALTWRVTAIATAAHGCVLSSRGIDLLEAVGVVSSGRQLTEIDGATSVASTAELIEQCDADVLFETTPLNPNDGQPAIDYIRSALSRRINVITANKGPIACKYRELRDLAKRFNVGFRFEGTVMDGTPVFNLVETCLPGTRVFGFEAILNSTTNLILTLMEDGRPFDESLSEAQLRGIAEANPDYDIDGWDAVMKAKALANVLMDAERRGTRVECEGIRGIDAGELKAARDAGFSIRVVARAVDGPESVMISVRPERVKLDSLFATIRGTSNVLVLKTDLMGEIAIVEQDPGVRQTAYALLSDLLRM